MSRLWMLYTIVFCCTLSKNGFAQLSNEYQLIAHRGGVVSEVTMENSIESLEEAIKQGYHRVEIDMRLTKDGVLVAHHDAHLRNTFGVGKAIREMEWQEIAALEGENGYKVCTVEELLRRCEGRIEVMIDNKISGYEEKAFLLLVDLLNRYHLKENAIMIGTSASKHFFTGKIKLSSTREQLEGYRKEPEFDPDHYYLFDRMISSEDLSWAEAQGIMVVAAVNSFHFDKDHLMEQAEKRISILKNNGVRIFQIDSIFGPFFQNP